MKSTYKITKVLLTIGITVFFSCQKKVEISIPEIKNLNDKAMVQVYIGTVSAARNYVYVNNTPVTGAGLATGGVFPSTGYASATNSGTSTFLIKDTQSTTKQLPLEFTKTLEAKRSYTIFMYDTITSPKQLMTETPLYTLSKTEAQVRFVNIIYAKTNVPAVDIYSTVFNKNLFTNVSVGSATNLIAIPTGYSDNIIVRVAGTTTQLAVINSLILQSQRAYTLVFRGSYFVTSGTNARTLSVITNY